jgi:hypothetical protein
VATPRGHDSSPPTPEERVADATSQLALALSSAAPTANAPVATLAALASLELVSPGVMPDPASFEWLTPREVELLAAWRDTCRAAAERFASDPNDILSLYAAVTGLSDRLEAGQPLQIRDARLCTRVEGYGKYTPIDGAALLAGRTHPLIVYAELERFAAPAATGQGGARGYRVELTQDIALYHDADGLLAWREGEQVIADFSRTKWRDFYLVHVIELPQTLTVGKYRLKITTRDRLNDNATAETVIPLDIVADPKLASAPPNHARR